MVPTRLAATAVFALMIGCATTEPTEFSDSMVRIQYRTGGFGVPDDDKLQIKLDAIRLCSVYGRRAVYISEDCTNIDLIRCSVWEVTFACTDDLTIDHCAFDRERRRSKVLDWPSLCVPDDDTDYEKVIDSLDEPT